MTVYKIAFQAWLDAKRISHVRAYHSATVIDTDLSYALVFLIYVVLCSQTDPNHPSLSFQLLF